MSHLTERKEKVCLNCQASVHGRFCHVCGQENIEPKESFWHLVTHFMYDITHFDGKFFSTLKYLLFRPGHLSHEYLRGRRADYLHPIRMYVFTSAFFFLIFFTLNKEDAIVNVKDSSRLTAAYQMKELEKNRAKFLKLLADTSANLVKNTFQKQLIATDSDIARLKRDTMAKNSLKTLSGFTVFGNASKDYKNVASYDSAQAKLPAGKRDNFIERRFTRQKIHLDEKYNHEGKAIWTAILDKFKHLFPQMLFVSLPLFALVLQLLYVRKKNFFYVNHVVFSIHLYCGTFIIILGRMGMEILAKELGYTGAWIGSLFTLAGLFYWYKSMRNFYEQRRAKTILKYLLVLVMSLIIMTLLFTAFFIFSAMSI